MENGSRLCKGRTCVVFGKTKEHNARIADVKYGGSGVQTSHNVCGKPADAVGLHSSGF